MKKRIFTSVILVFALLCSCDKAPSADPNAMSATEIGTTSSSSSNTESANTLESTAAETTAEQLTLPDVLSAILVRGSGTQKAASCYRDYIESVFGARPSSLLYDKYDPEADGAAIRLECDESYAEHCYSITCDGENAEIKGKTTTELNYAVARFLQEYVDNEGNFIPCNAENTMVRLRDPCVLAYDGKYYAVGTGYSMRVSDDLYNWSEPWQFLGPNGPANPAYDGIADHWAPELYYYNGAFYIFGAYTSASTGHLGMGVFRCDTPEGPYDLISDGHVTPDNWNSCDGTLYVDENGDPWMIFGTSMDRGFDANAVMAASKMSADLTSFVGEIHILFEGYEMPHSNNANKTVDAPCIYRFENGRLALTWSGFGDFGYCIAVSYSDNGILGPWEHSEDLLFSTISDNPICYQEGGHGRLFETFDGRLLMSFHSPNSTYEAVTYREVIAENGTLRLK